jgi:hypothetical protein
MPATKSRQRVATAKEAAARDDTSRAIGLKFTTL